MLELRKRSSSACRGTRIGYINTYVTDKAALRFINQDTERATWYMDDGVTLEGEGERFGCFVVFIINWTRFRRKIFFGKSSGTH